MQSFSNILAFFLEKVSPALLDKQGKQRIYNVTNHLPAGLAWSQFGFETRLDYEAVNFDFALSITNNSPGLSILAGEIPTQGISATMMQKKEWQQIKRFSSRWLNNDIESVSVPDVLFLEFDMPASEPKQAIPLVFFGITPQSDLYRSKLGVKNHTVLENCLSFFARDYVASCIFESLRQCDLKAVKCSENDSSYHAGVDQVGLMLSRSTEYVRFCVNGLSANNISAYLGLVGWPGDLQRLNEVLAGVASSFDYIILALDCSVNGLSPKLGLECYFADNMKPSADTRWQQVLVALVKLNLCRSAKAEALLEFSGHQSLIPLANHELDSALAGQPGYFVPRGTMQGLHHLKIIIEPDGKLTTKAYLWCQLA